MAMHNQTNYGDFFGVALHGFSISEIEKLRYALLMQILPFYNSIIVEQSLCVDLVAKGLPKKRFIEIANSSFCSEYLGFYFQSKESKGSNQWISGGLSLFQGATSFTVSMSANGTSRERDSPSIDKLIKRLERNGISYGYNFSEKDTNDPFLYAFGKTRFKPHTEPGGQLLKLWSSSCAFPDTDAPFRHGVLREIYEVNYLNQTHLDVMHAGKSLPQLIKIDPRFGRLESLGLTCWKWSILREYIDFVRQRLAGTAWLSLAVFVETFYEKQKQLKAPKALDSHF
jgi:hypothetical protein